MIINVLFVFLMVSKIAVIIIGLLILTRQLYGKKARIRFPIAFVLLAGIGALILSSRSYSQANPDEKTSFFEQTLTWELRTKVWNCVKQIHETEGLVLAGYGYAETKNKLVTCYEEQISDEQKRQEFIEARYNTHNQFVDIYFNWGIIAVFLFVTFLVVVFYTNRKFYIPTAYLIVLVSYCMVENVFHRQIGAYYVGFILIMILITNQLAKNKEEKTDV